MSKIDQTISKIDQNKELLEKQQFKLTQLKNELIRLNFANDPVFWLDKMNWKKLSYGDRLKIIFKYGSVIHSPYKETNEAMHFFYEFAREVWRKDRKEILKNE